MSEKEMKRRKCDLSSTEVLLSILFLLLLVVCLCLIVITWLTLHPDTPAETEEENLSGRLVISQGAMFTEELRNKSSMPFKALAFDVEHLVSEIYSRSSLGEKYKACKVVDFSHGSVVVTFDLCFAVPVGAEAARQKLTAGVQASVGTQGALVIDANSILISAEGNLPTVPTPITTPLPTAVLPIEPTSTTEQCAIGQKACADGQTCIPEGMFCDGVYDCPNGSDEDKDLCATTCDGNFLLLGPTGSFHSKNFPLPYDSDTTCRWVIRVQDGHAIHVGFMSFDTEQDMDVLNVYEGTGKSKNLTTTLTGSSPGSLLILHHEATVEFLSDYINNLKGFNATYWEKSLRDLTNAEKVNCSFEGGLCFWQQDQTEDGDWLRINTPTFPPMTGPNFDHTLSNQSGYYIVTPGGPTMWTRRFRLYSLPLSHSAEPMCLGFWYHMYGVDVSSLKVFVENRTSVTVLFQKEGNYGNQWNYGQVTLNDTVDLMVVFEAQKTRGIKNDIALDDISLTNGRCVEGVHPEPTPVPSPTTPPPMPSDCGGPFDLWEPNSTFSSPNYPHSYGNGASCVWTLHGGEGKNIQLHFLGFDVEATYDVVEVRDGPEGSSELLGVFTGHDVSIPDVFSTTNQMTLLFFTDSSGYGRGFNANFTSGFGLGQPEPCAVGLYQCRSGACISNTSVCDSQPDCSDASDEAKCVNLQSEGNGTTNQLQLQVQNSWYTVCADNWTPQLSQFLCNYLGFRAGNASVVPLAEKNGSFITMIPLPNGTLDIKLSDVCAGGMVVSLRCDNKPCGIRMVQQPRGTERREGSEVNEEEEEDEGSRVVGGTDAKEGAWPWTVSLHWKRRHVCGASLIDREWLITAAHCVYGKNMHLSHWAALLGLHRQGDSQSPHTETRRIDRVIFNKIYNKRTKEGDVAMMHLETPVNFTDFIQPICLPDSEELFEPGRECFIAGWGRVAEQGSVADVLQEAVLPLLSQAECQKQLPEYDITARMVCAGYPDGAVDSCQGDSGGPLMCHQDGHWMLAGITSFGVGCGRPGRPGVYARVSEFTDWVAEVRRFS